MTLKIKMVPAGDSKNYWKYTYSWNGTPFLFYISKGQLPEQKPLTAELEVTTA